MNIIGVINKLRKSSIILFCLSFTAIIGCLIINNILVSFKYSNSLYPLNFKVGTIIYCNASNNYCTNILDKKVYLKSLGDCNKFQKHLSVYYGNKILSREEFINLNIPFSERAKFNDSREFYIKILQSGENDGYKNLNCIKNSNIYDKYNSFSILFDLIARLKEDPRYTAGTSIKVNPYLYGETSISNIAKRFPQNYVFKSLLFISAVIMFFYWKYNNIIFKNITSIKKNNPFLIFGYSSAVFLFLHVLLLGQSFELKILMTFKKLIIVSFILSELLAQFYLVRTIKNNLNSYINLINRKIFKLKIFLIYSVIIISIFIIFILIFRDLTKEVDYILEWNYFTILLFYYLLSYYMWKKN